MSECYVCSQDAIVQPTQNTSSEVQCKRCGNYLISYTAASCDLELYGPKHILSGIIRNFHERGEKLDLDTNKIPILFQSINIPTDPFDLIDMLLEFLLKKAQKIQNDIHIDAENDFPVLYLEDSQGFIYYMYKASELGYIHLETNCNCVLTLDGWKRLKEIQDKRKISKQAFIAMWFDKSMDEIWEKGFKQALTETGYNPIRIDLTEHNEKICDRIIAEIRQSGLLIADFTGQRGGVYFEAGFALGLGIPVIWTCKEDDVKSLHFDTRQYNHITWNNADELKEKLVNRIRATVVIP